MVQTMAEKVHSYQMDTGSLPGSLEDLVRQPGNASGWLGPYAKEGDLKDPWNTPYVYRVPGENGAFDLVSLGADRADGGTRSEEHTSELQSLMRISYAVFCLNKKTHKQ